jgi:hypothetical protein
MLCNEVLPISRLRRRVAEKFSRWWGTVEMMKSYDEERKGRGKEAMVL